MQINDADGSSLRVGDNHFSFKQPRATVMENWIEAR